MLISDSELIFHNKLIIAIIKYDQGNVSKRALVLDYDSIKKSHIVMRNNHDLLNTADI